MSRDDRGRFRPGTSGNPGGRPAGSVSLKSLILERLAETSEHLEGRSLAQELVRRTIADAIRGDAQARRLIFEYCEGRPQPQAPAQDWPGMMTMAALVRSASEDDAPDAIAEAEGLEAEFGHAPTFAEIMAAGSDGED